MDIVKRTQKKVAKSQKQLAKTISLTSYQKLATNFFILSVLLIALILYFSLSQASIEIRVAKNQFTNTTTIPVVADLKDQIQASVVGTINETQVSHAQTFPVTTTKSVEDNAIGVITIFNTTKNRNQTFVQNTRFVNENDIEVKITKRIDLSPGEQISVDAFASVPGTGGQVSQSSGRFQVAALPYLQDQIYAEVTTAFTNGVREVAILSPSTFENARKTVENKLKEQAIEQLPNDIDIIDASGIDLELTTFTATANPGDEFVDDFTIEASGVARAFVYDKIRAKEIAKQQLISTLKPDKIVVNFDDDSYIEKPITIDNSIESTITAYVQPRFSEKILNEEELFGMNQSQVEEYFTKVTGIRDVQVKFSPFWVKKVPKFKDHIQIEIK